MIGYLSWSEVIAYVPCRSDVRRPVSVSSLLDRVHQSTRTVWDIILIPVP